MARRIDDLPAVELKALLETDPDELSESVTRAIEDFVQRIGGIGNAHLAVEMLEGLERPDDRPGGPPGKRNLT
jgi:hypothetical protein